MSVTKFEQILAIIKGQLWYTTNTRLQEYLQSEWISCKEVSYYFHCAPRLKISHDIVILLLFVVMGTCLSAVIPWWNKHKQHNRVVQ